MQGKFVVKAGEGIGNGVAGARDMDHANLGPGTDQSIDHKNKQVIIWRGCLEGVPYVDSVLVIGVDDDAGEVVTFVEDGARCHTVKRFPTKNIYKN